jgi:hypothetical protein
MGSVKWVRPPAHFVLFGMQNRSFGPCFVAVDGIFVVQRTPSNGSSPLHLFVLLDHHLVVAADMQVRVGGDEDARQVLHTFPATSPACRAMSMTDIRILCMAAKQGDQTSYSECQTGPTVSYCSWSCAVQHTPSKRSCQRLLIATKLHTEIPPHASVTGRANPAMLQRQEEGAGGICVNGPPRARACCMRRAVQLAASDCYKRRRAPRCRRSALACLPLRRLQPWLPGLLGGVWRQQACWSPTGTSPARACAVWAARSACASVPPSPWRRLGFVPVHS